MLRSLIARVPALTRLATRQQSTSAATAAVKSATKTPAVAERLLASHGAESHPLGTAANPAKAVSRNVKMAAEGKPAAAAAAAEQDERHITSRYGLDLPLDVHHPIENMSDRVARRIVTLLRIPMDAFFSKRYISRAVMLETVAAVPGMVGGMLQHLKSLRRMKDDRGWIYTLLEEAENERMHLLTFVKILRPSWPERMLVLFAQGIMFNVYFLMYLFAPKTAHRFVGYLEEEAIVSYTSFLKEIDEGHIKNTPAPDIAKRYWSMPDDATLRDLVIAIRMDEAMHRDVNHGFADAIVRQRRGQQNA